MNHKNTPPSSTPKIWVLDGERVFCFHGKPHAFDGSALDWSVLDGQLGVVRLHHFDDEHHHIRAVDRRLVGEVLCDGGEFVPYRHAITSMDWQSAHEISAGIQFLLWQRLNQFCGACGTKTYAHHHEHAMICPACHQCFYPKIQPCVIVAITRSCPKTGKTQILLAKHRRHLASGMYGLIAGFMEAGESVEMAVHREVMEETGLGVDGLCYIQSQAWPYPTNLMLGFLAQYKSGEIVVDNKELSHARFFDCDDLPAIPKKGTIAFSLICKALQKDVSAPKDLRI